MVKRFETRHEVYALNLAGFCGRPPVEPPIYDKVVADIIRLIKEQRVRQPVLIGHSLGAHIAYRVAIEASDLTGGVIALDGLPVLGPLADADPAVRRAAGEKLANELGRGKSQQQFIEALPVLSFGPG